MVDINPTIFNNHLNNNENTPVKRQRLSEWIKNQGPTI